MLPFSLKESRLANLLQAPQRGPYGEKYPLTGHFYLSFNISLLIFPSESPVREPPPCSLTGPPWAAILLHQSHWSTFHPFLHSYMSAGVPRKESSYIHMGKNIRSPSTEPHADRRPTYSGGGDLVPQGDRYDTAVSTPLPCSLQLDTFHFGLGRPEPRQLSCVVATPIRVYSPQLLLPPT